jgi:hypothetical protein
MKAKPNRAFGATFRDWSDDFPVACRLHLGNEPVALFDSGDVPWI